MKSLWLRHVGIYWSVRRSMPEVLNLTCISTVSWGNNENHDKSRSRQLLLELRLGHGTSRKRSFGATNSTTALLSWKRRGKYEYSLIKMWKLFSFTSICFAVWFHYMVKLVNGILRRLEQLPHVARVASEVRQVQEQRRWCIMLLDDCHRLLCEHVRRVAASQVQSRQNVAVEIHTTQLGTARPVLQPRSIHL